MHIDIDSLAATNSIKNIKQLIQQSRQSRQRQQSPELRRAKLELKAMHKSLEQMMKELKLPEKPEHLSKEEVAALAGRPQKSWSVQTPVEKAGSPVVIPKKLHKQGYVSSERENDVLGMTPGHEKAIKVANRTYRLLKTGNLKSGHSDLKLKRNPNYDLYKLSLEEPIRLFQALNNGANMVQSETLDQQQVIDYFRLAEKIRRMGPALQEKMDALTSIAQDTTKNRQERNIAKMRIEALGSIYQASCDVVDSFINKNSYFPQVENFSSKTYQDFLKLFQSIFNTDPQYVSTASWKGSELQTTVGGSDAVPASLAQMKHVFKEIKAMIRRSETE